MKSRKKTKENLAAPETGEMVCVVSSDKKEVVCAPAGEVVKVEAKELPTETEKKRENVWIGTINFFAAPYQSLKGSYENRYGQARKLFIIDLILLVVVGVLLGLNIYLFVSPLVSDNNYSAWFKPVQNTNGEVSDASAPDLLAQIKINGQESLVITPGEDLEYEVSYLNRSKKDIYDVALKIDLLGTLLDFSRVSPDKGVVRGAAIVWTKDQIPEFAKLTSGAKGVLKFKIGTAGVAEPARALQFGGLLKSWTEISYKLGNDFGPSSSFRSAAREDKFSSDLTLAALARYYTAEGDQLGTGPLPPAVGRTTKYWIFWSVENNLNDVADVSVSAVLPSNVSWTDNKSVSLGELSYNSTRRIVTWKVGEVGRYTDEDLPKRGAAFELILTPTPEQAGMEPALLSQVKIFGEDKFTDQFLEKREADLTTNLIYDSLAGGKSKVVK